MRYPLVFVLHQLFVLTPRLGPRRESDTDYGNIFPLSPLDTGHSISIILIVVRRGWLHLWSPVAGLHLLLIFYTRGTEKIIGFCKIVESFGAKYECFLSYIAKKLLHISLFMFDCVKCSCSYSISFVTLEAGFLESFHCHLRVVQENYSVLRGFNTSRFT